MLGKDLFKNLLRVPCDFGNNSILKKSTGRKVIAVLTLTAFLTGSMLFSASGPAAFALEEDTQIGSDLDRPVLQRYAGESRYDTAASISQDWFEAYNLVLARGDAFPDALAGAVLAKSSIVNGPLMLTPSNSLNSAVKGELERLNTRTVYILGGPGAISQAVENELAAMGIQVARLSGSDRYETAAAIAATAVENSDKAFVASGMSFADALSVSSYAAAHGIPLLLTAADKVPEATMSTLELLGVQEVTLVGGEGVITPAAAEELKGAGLAVNRLSGANRYQTNIDIMNKLDFNREKLFVATGASFPDALAGSVLAAKDNSPIMLLPEDETKISEQTTSYLNNYREGIKNFSILGGWGVINYKLQSIVRTGEAHERVSLHFWDGYSNYDKYVEELSLVPGEVTDYIDILAPNFPGALQVNGSFEYRFDSAEIPKKIVALGHKQGTRVVPMVMGSGSIADDVLTSSSRRQNFVKSAVKMINETNADGILVDFEGIKDELDQELVSLMRELYEVLHPKNKLVMVSVMSRIEGWNKEYNYRELAKYADYIQIMSYDKHYSISAPGPIAPLDWVRDVMTYAVNEIKDTHKILMGIPYYGRAWKETDQTSTGWTSRSFGWAVATDTAEEHSAVINRCITGTDPVGVPTFKYIDEDGCERTAYFEDPLSIKAKMQLINEFGLGGIGVWSMIWINEKSAPVIYPVIKENLR